MRHSRGLCAFLCLLLAGWAHAGLRVVWESPGPVAGYTVHAGSEAVDVGAATSYVLPASVALGTPVRVDAYNALREVVSTSQVLALSEPPVAATGVSVRWRHTMSTWGPTAIAANADDGCNAGGTWYANGIQDLSVYQNFLDDNTHAGFSFQLPAIGATATISKCYFRARTGPSAGGGAVPFKLGIQDVDPATAVVWSSSNLPSTSTTWIEAPAAQSRSFSTTAWYFGEADTHPLNLASALQAIITKYGAINSGDRLNVGLIKYTNDASSYAGFEDYNDAGTNHPSLYIEWTEGGGSTLNINVQDCFDTRSLFGGL